MFKKLLIFVAIFGLIFYATNAYAKVFLYKNKKGITYLVRDDNYAANGRNAITIKYSSIVRFEYGYSFHDGLAYIEINHKSGFINKNSVLIIPAIYRGAWGFRDGLAAVESNSRKWGFINKKGKWVISPKFKFAGNFHDGLAAVESNNGKSGFINKKGKWIISPKFSNVGGFHDELSVAKFKSGEKWGFIDKNGIMVIPQEFIHAGDFQDG